MEPKPFPEREQMLLPLLGVLQSAGGTLAAGDAIAQVAEVMRIPRDIRDNFETKDCGRWGLRNRSAFRQEVHWARFLGTRPGYVTSAGYGRWQLTDRGTDALANAKPGVIVTVWETPSGEVLWADAVSAAAHLQPNSLNLVFTSPPYKLITGRKYGRYTESELISLIVSSARGWKDALTEDGSIILNFKDCWEAGMPVRSLYQERLLLALHDELSLFCADKFVWNNPSHGPDSAWVTVRKVRTNCAHENLFWLSKTPNPKARPERVMVPAKQSTIDTYLRRARRGALQTGVGPSKHNTHYEEQAARVVAGEQIKVTARNIIEVSNADTHKKFREDLRALKLEDHDAMMPLKLAEWFIQLTTDAGDHVYDPFWGAGTTGLAASRLGRIFSGSERSLSHVISSSLRFEEVRFKPLAA